MDYVMKMEVLFLSQKMASCSKPMAYPFWKEVGDVNNQVQTRNQIRNTRPAYLNYILNYFTEKRLEKMKNDGLSANISL